MITDKEFEKIVLYVKARYGIDLSQKRVLVNGRLETYFFRNGYDNFADFMAKVESEPQGEAAKGLINVLTTNHTYFMRESVHFDYFMKVVLPYLKVKEADNRDLRIWSGASSTGEEPYTIAMILMDFFGLDHPLWDTKVLATDISTEVLNHAIKGIYLEEDIKPLPDRWKRRFFKSLGNGQFEVRDELKKEVIYRQFNLMNQFPFKRKFHVVFLRNVMIYFPDDVKYPLVNKIYEFTEPGGYLFIGTTESLDKTKMPFKYVQPSIYRKEE